MLHLSASLSKPVTCCPVHPNFTLAQFLSPPKTWRYCWKALIEETKVPYPAAAKCFKMTNNLLGSISSQTTALSATQYTSPVSGDPLTSQFKRLPSAAWPTPSVFLSTSGFSDCCHNRHPSPSEHNAEQLYQSKWIQMWWNNHIVDQLYLLLFHTKSTFVTLCLNMVFVLTKPGKLPPYEKWG